MSQANKEKRGVFHFHSNYSFDCRSPIGAIADKLEALDLDFAILTDHDDVRGSLALRDELVRRGSGIFVPPAAEYSSELGDIIVVGVEQNLAGMSSVDMMSMAKKLGGAIVLPHPYDGHTLCDELLDGVDAIEIFNGRSSPLNNEKSKELAVRYNKPVVYSADAHMLGNLENVIIAMPAEMSFNEALLGRAIRAVSMRSSPKSDITLSQLIKAHKTKNVRLFFRILAGSVINLIRARFPILFAVLKKVRSIL